LQLRDEQLKEELGYNSIDGAQYVPKSYLPILNKLKARQQMYIKHGEECEKQLKYLDTVNIEPERTSITVERFNELQANLESSNYGKLNELKKFGKNSQEAIELEIRENLLQLNKHKKHYNKICSEIKNFQFYETKPGVDVDLKLTYVIKKDPADYKDLLTKREAARNDIKHVERKLEDLKIKFIEPEHSRDTGLKVKQLQTNQVKFEQVEASQKKAGQPQTEQTKLEQIKATQEKIEQLDTEELIIKEAQAAYSEACANYLAEITAASIDLS